MGGDPASYPRIIDLAKHAKLSYGMDVSILSNTLLFRNFTPYEVSKYITSFETTIHHVQPDLHDKICKKEGAYENIIEQLAIYSRLGCKTGIAINITHETYDKIFQLASRIVNVEKIPLNYIIIQRIIPFGRAAKSSGFTLTRDQAEKSLYEIKKVDIELGVGIFVEDPFPLCVLSESLKKYMRPCQWGITRASINHEGGLSRCGADPRYRLGNILKTPLLEIWNNSEILISFRNKNYLPGRCKICQDFHNCGGGCPLSCEIEKDHGIDYLFSEFEKLNEEIHGEIIFSQAMKDELSSILQIEWSNFPGYGHLFSVESIKKWYHYNPRMFWVVKDSLSWILGYAVLVPLMRCLFKRIKKGEFSSLVQFPEKGVLRKNESDYYHIEVLSSVPSRTASRAGRYLIKSIGYYIINNTKYVSASPVTDIGVRLCEYFNFKKVTSEVSADNSYPIYLLTIDKKSILKKINKF